MMPTLEHIHRCEDHTYDLKKQIKKYVSLKKIEKEKRSLSAFV